ncbi:MAG: hypothetical protein ACLFN2_00125 [Bacteroidales bacterium]
MKQSGTIENYFIMYSHPKQNSIDNNYEIVADNRQPARCGQIGQQSLPGKHVIRNIMNYSRALTVLQRGENEHLFILNN